MYTPSIGVGPSFAFYLSTRIGLPNQKYVGHSKSNETVFAKNA